MQFLKSLFSMFSKSGIDLPTEHMAFIEQLLEGDLDEKALAAMVMDYIGGQSGDASSLMGVLETVIGDAESQGDSGKLDILNIVKDLIK